MHDLIAINLLMNNGWNNVFNESTLTIYDCAIFKDCQQQIRFVAHNIWMIQGFSFLFKKKKN
jgi:hypothetical protein